jgi:hypothetical protein
MSDNSDENETTSPRRFRRDIRGLFYTGCQEYRVLIDPLWYHLENPDQAALELQHLVAYARKVTTPVDVELLYPRYLEPPQSRRWFGAWFHDPDPREVGPPTVTKEWRAVSEVFAPVRAAFDALADAARSSGEVDTGDAVAADRMLYGSLTFGRSSGLDLVKLSMEHEAEFILTQNPWLLDAADALRELGVWIGDPETILERVQLALRAAGVFLEVVSPYDNDDLGAFGRLRVPIEGLGFSNFYQMGSQRGFVATAWFDSASRHYQHQQRVVAYARAALLHRLPFLQYSHDLIRHHADFAQLVGEGGYARAHHRFYVAYHLNAFYVNLAALLDNISWFWNHALALGFVEYGGEKQDRRSKCGLNRKGYRERLRVHHPKLASLLDDTDFQDWLSHLPIKRDPAAHREPLFLTEIREEGTNKLISDAALVFEAQDGQRALDLLQAANADLARAWHFLEAMFTLAFPSRERAGK